MNKIIFAKPAAIKLGDHYLTDHNRQPVSITYERIEDVIRTQFGAMRKYHRADKRSMSLSWEMVPDVKDQTVDGNLGAKDMEELFLDTTDFIELTLTYDDDIEESWLVSITGFSIELVKRWGEKYYYNVSLEMSEV